MNSMTVCPGCGLVLPSAEGQLDDRLNASSECKQLYWELCAYTLSRQDTYFIHQLAIDAYTAQHAGAMVKPIGLTFALVSLYLVVEHGYTGKQAQKAHMLLANTPKRWPQFGVPAEKASLTIFDVLKAPEKERDNMIREWGKVVWDIWQAERAKVVELVRERLGLY